MNDEYDYLLLTATGCPHCSEAKKILRPKIEEGKISVADIFQDKKAHELAKKLKIDEVPKMILIKKNEKIDFVEACDLSADAKKLLCKDREVEL